MFRKFRHLYISLLAVTAQLCDIMVTGNIKGCGHYSLQVDGRVLGVF